MNQIKELLEQHNIDSESNTPVIGKTDLNPYLKYYQNQLKEKIEDYLDIDGYQRLVLSLIKKLDTGNKELLLDLFSHPSELNISTYKKVLRLKGNKSWKKEYCSKKDVYDHLALKLTNSLQYRTLDDTLILFSKQIKYLERVMDKKPEEITTIFKEYQEAVRSKDTLAISNANGKIKDMIRKFNAKAKEEHINKVVEMDLEQIRPNFESKEEKHHLKSDMSYIETYKNLVMGNPNLRDSLKKAVLEVIGFVVNNEQLEQIISNTLKNQDQNNLMLFDLEEPEEYQYLNRTKALNRLNQNYMKRIQKIIPVELYGEVGNYLEADSPQNKAIFSKVQLSLLNEIKPIVKEGDAQFEFDNQNIVFNTKERILSSSEQFWMKDYQSKLKEYRSLKNTIFSTYQMQCNLLKDIKNNYQLYNNETLTFSDENYELVDRSYLLNIENIFKIIYKLDPEKIQTIDIYSRDYQFLRKLLVNDGLIACNLVNENNCDIAEIINSFPQFPQSFIREKLDINHLEEIFKKAKLYSIADRFTIDLLGEEVVDKIVNNSQFLENNNSKEDINLRLLKAIDLVMRSTIQEQSTIPYLGDVSIGNMVLRRYHNNDSKLLTSGIDSNTCFKISANDNDYLFYSVLNKNGFVAQFLEDNVMVGRITAHRMNNVFLINGVRTITNEYQANSLDELQRNQKIIDVLKEYANQLIDATKDSDDPIDFVVSNKAGILESPEFDRTFSMVEPRYFENPFDTYNENWEEFKRTYADKSYQYLQEVPYHTSNVVSPFTTDFGSFPIVMIASRDKKELNRKWDISMNDPEAIYMRPRSAERQINSVLLTEKELERLRKIDSLACLCENDMDGVKACLNYQPVEYSKNLDLVTYGEDWYITQDNDGKLGFNIGIENDRMKSEMEDCIIKKRCFKKR